MEGGTRSEAVDHSRRDPDSNSSSPGAPIDGFCAQNSENCAENGNRNDEGQKRSDFYEKNEVRAFAGVGSNNARYKSMSPARLPISRSPCLTIPPGLSPTSLLDSPILLSNMKAEPSPTTGTFSMPRVMRGAVGDHSFSSPRGATNNSTNDEGSAGDFEFKTHIKPCSISGLSSLGPMASVGSIYQQGMTFAPPASVPTENVTVASHDLSLSVIPSNPAVFIVNSEARTTVNGHPDEDRQRRVSDNGNHVSQPDHNGPNPSAVVERTSEDGYNWRKYGQKLVKGSEFPRSYYKCTHPNCQVKKQMERSPDGQITEIIYKGKHDHPKPQPSRRFAVGAMLSSQGEERSDCFSLNTEEKPSSAQGQGPNHIETCGTSELSPVSASDEDMEGTGAQPNKVADEIDDEDDPESKRRKKDIGGIDVSPLGKMTREPRVVVQTLSEVDILDDGYRWRKYGQKVVKGNPNPRSYYKCTNAGCPVRKHVERASHDPKAVITTYEGKHNHDVPSARNSSHHTAGPTPLSDANALNGQMTAVLNGMLRTDQPEESDVISLNLGVGISSNSEMHHNKQLSHDEEQVQSQIHMGGPGCGKLVHVAPVSSYYGGGLGGSDQYGTREDQGESFSFTTPPFNHSSAPCRQNLGRLVMGP